MLRAMTLAAAAMAVTGGGVSGLIVVYANRALGLARTDPRIGLLFSAAAAGSAAAAVLLPRLRRRVRPGPLMLISLAAAAVLLAAVAAAPGFGAALAALACFDLAYTMVTLGGITLLQEVTPPGLQSRVNTTGRMLGWGTFPVGAALGGGLAEVLPVRVTLLVLAAPVIVAVLLGLRSPLRRQRYTPALAQGRGGAANGAVTSSPPA
jgi:MFS family permease